MGSLLMEQKALSLKESYELYSGGELKYFIRRRKLLTSKPAYDVFTEDGVIASAEVTSSASPLIYKLTFKGNAAGEVRFDGIPGVNILIYEEKGLEIIGNSILSEFTIKDRSKTILGTIKKKLVSMKDTYDIQFSDDTDELLFAMLALLVDETFHG